MNTFSEKTLIHPSTHDCKPTLSDTEVLEFLKNGYLRLEGVVPDDINQRVLKYCNANPDLLYMNDILYEEWFVEGVMRNTEVAGAVRSLLGKDFHLPVQMVNHRVECPIASVGGWHIDGNYNYTHELNFLQVFYYPQDTPVEMGPTQLVPGTHLVRQKSRLMGHLGNIKNTVSTDAPAGSVFITVYHIWHRRPSSIITATRNLLKYFYWRTSPPERDWTVDPNFDFATADYDSPASSLVEQFRSAVKVAETFLWLCGKHEIFQNLGGQSFPLPVPRTDLPYGFPEGLKREYPSE